jgi:hypothetical protein
MIRDYGLWKRGRRLVDSPLSTKEIPFSYQQRKVFALPPKKKQQKTLQLLRNILSEPLELLSVKVSFDIQSLVTLDTLKEQGKIMGMGE